MHLRSVGFPDGDLPDDGKSYLSLDLLLVTPADLHRGWDALLFVDVRKLEAVLDDVACGVQTCDGFCFVETDGWL